MKRLAPFLFLLWACGAESPRLDVSSDVERCKENLIAIHEGLIAYTKEVGHPPRASGVGLLAELVSSGVWADSAENRERLTCPGDHAELIPPDTDYRRVDQLTAASSSYAAHDMRRQPVAAYPIGGPELTAMVACDNSGGALNHDGVMNALFSDGSIRTYVLSELIERGVVPAGTTTIAVGPGSPLEELRILTED